jgi:hypothetical protein
VTSEETVEEYISYYVILVFSKYYLAYNAALLPQ